MTDDKPKLNGCAIGVVLLLIPTVLAFGTLLFWILLEFGQWIGRQ